MKKTCAAILVISMALFWAGGCQEEQVSSGDKMARLTAAENANLKTQIQQEAKKHDEEIEKLNMQMQKEAKQRDDEIKNLNGKIKELTNQFHTEKEKLNADVDNLSKQLAECVQERRAVQEKAEKDIEKLSEELSEGVVAPILDDMQKLKTENAQLKAELSNCKGKK